MHLQQDYPCPYCSNGCQQIYHGGRCPQVKSIEYHENGTVKKVEFFDPTQVDYKLQLC